MSELRPRSLWDAKRESLPPPEDQLSNPATISDHYPRPENAGRLRRVGDALLRLFGLETTPAGVNTNRQSAAVGAGPTGVQDGRAARATPTPEDIQDLLEKFPGRIEHTIHERREGGEAVSLLFAGPEGPDLYDLYRLPSTQEAPQLHDTLNAAATQQFEDWKREWGISDDVVSKHRPSLLPGRRNERSDPSR